MVGSMHVKEKHDILTPYPPLKAKIPVKTSKEKTQEKVTQTQTMPSGSGTSGGY